MMGPGATLVYRAGAGLRLHTQLELIQDKEVGSGKCQAHLNTQGQVQGGWGVRLRPEGTAARTGPGGGFPFSWLCRQFALCNLKEQVHGGLCGPDVTGTLDSPLPARPPRSRPPPHLCGQHRGSHPGT